MRKKKPSAVSNNFSDLIGIEEFVATEENGILKTPEGLSIKTLTKSVYCFVLFLMKKVSLH